MYTYRLLTPTESFEVSELHYVDEEEVEKSFKKSKGEFLTEPVHLSGTRIEILDDEVRIWTSDISVHTFQILNGPFGGSLIIKEVQLSPSTESGIDFDISVSIGKHIA